MIGAVISVPNDPLFVIVYVPPESSIGAELVLARTCRLISDDLLCKTGNGQIARVEE